LTRVDVACGVSAIGVRVPSLTTVLVDVGAGVFVSVGAGVLVAAAVEVEVA
jgi:hypothetical protein